MLKILSFLYLIIIKIRNYAFDIGLFSSYQSKFPIICVGNATAGGNGKTPVVIKIVQDLLLLGYRPVVLSRGYGGKISGPHLLTTTDTPNDVGDEPVLIFEETNCPIVVARKRVAGCQLIENLQLGNIIVMDDGYQHRQLIRDLNILCFDISQQSQIEIVTNGLLLPAGRLREPLPDALRRCQMVILNSRKNKFSNLNLITFNKLFESLPVYQTKLRSSNLSPLLPPKDLINLELTPRKVILLSAIAKPEGFLESIEYLGFQVVDKVFYPDHFQFTLQEINKIRKEHPELPILCTAKDAVKIRRLTAKLDNFWVLKTELFFKNETPDWKKFLKF